MTDDYSAVRWSPSLALTTFWTAYWELPWTASECESNNWDQLQSFYWINKGTCHVFCAAGPRLSDELLIYHLHLLMPNYKQENVSFQCLSTCSDVGFSKTNTNLLHNDSSDQSHRFWGTPVLSVWTHGRALQLVHGPISFLREWQRSLNTHIRHGTRMMLWTSLSLQQSSKKFQCV